MCGRINKGEIGCGGLKEGYHNPTTKHLLFSSHDAQECGFQGFRSLIHQMGEILAEGATSSVKVYKWKPFYIIMVFSITYTIYEGHELNA